MEYLTHGHVTTLTNFGDCLNVGILTDRGENYSLDARGVVMEGILASQIGHDSPVTVTHEDHEILNMKVAKR